MEAQKRAMEEKQNQKDRLEQKVSSLRAQFEEEKRLTEQKEQTIKQKMTSLEKKIAEASGNLIICVDLSGTEKAMLMQELEGVQQSKVTTSFR